MSQHVFNNQTIKINNHGVICLLTWCSWDPKTLVSCTQNPHSFGVTPKWFRFLCRSRLANVSNCSWQKGHRKTTASFSSSILISSALEGEALLAPRDRMFTRFHRSRILLRYLSCKCPASRLLRSRKSRSQMPMSMSSLLVLICLHFFLWRWIQDRYINGFQVSASWKLE